MPTCPKSAQACRHSRNEAVRHDQVFALKSHNQQCITSIPGPEGGPTIIYLHAANGSAHAVRQLKGIVPARILAVRAPGLFGEVTCPATVAAEASIHAAELSDLGPFTDGVLLMGFSTGGLVALELARTLSNAIDVRECLMIDTPHPSDLLENTYSSEQVLRKRRLAFLLKRSGAPLEMVNLIRGCDDWPPSADTWRSVAGAEVSEAARDPLVRQAETYTASVIAARNYIVRLDIDVPIRILQLSEKRPERWLECFPMISWSSISAEHHDYAVFENEDVQAFLAGWYQSASAQL